MTAITHIDLPAQRTAPAAPRRSRGRYRRLGAAAAWWVASVALFAGIWELAWLMGWAPELLLPPPHIFLQDFSSQAQFFDTATIGAEQATPVVAVAGTVLATVLRVLAGLALGFLASLITGVLISQFLMVRGLVLPTITLLAPISPIAWLPVSIFLFGIGDGPAIFMVFIGVYFVMTLATIGLINDVPTTYIDVARTMGASRRQILFQVILPSILPGLLQSLRLNLFAAWMVVLLAEAVGVGSGLGQVVMLARNTFNSSLVFFSMTVIGIAGYLLDIAFRQMQNRLLWWQPVGKGALR
ncbi:ABC transporter permease [Mycolicibacterium duvalii]|uniref:ABC transporter permease n=1 Tax=Mycolicibacterium duvalii TaxID=39688 RepID=A0A7I7JZF6_9MYCO|nr:ABC transporter permease [Mycolicibacterium duvalii]MCV7366823.1 ABC transporter permease [Mycolicibacterium duvalii]PEG43950.1 ABC transporter permease [Mycolicibacterium duvalii]BBX16714.1 ABC transporter permease [Mycolicibacterium duvalii]